MKFSHPQSNILQLGLREGMKVADLGVGSGAYTLAAAGAVGESGRVYAIDIHEEMLRFVEDAARSHGYTTVETIWGDIENRGGTKLKDNAIDVAVLSNLLFQVENKEGVVSEIKRILKSGGKVLVVDWAGGYGGMGPLEESVVSEHIAEELFITGGFYKVKDFRAGPHHYAIVFTAP